MGYKSQGLKTLLMTSAMYTGTTFLRELLQMLPFLGMPLQTNHILDDKLSPFFWKDYLGVVRSDPQISLNGIEQYFQELSRANNGVVFVNGHVHEGWMHSILFFLPFPHKVIASIRHPFDALISKYLRGTVVPEDLNSGWMWSYLEVLRLKLNRPKDVVLIPVDLLGQKTEEERVTIISSLLGSLGISVAEKDKGCQEFFARVRSWEPLNAHKGEKSVSPGLYQEVIDRLDKSNVYYYLQRAGLNYRYKPYQSEFKSLDN